VDLPSQPDRPDLVSTLETIIKPARTRHVTGDPFDARALRARHLRLSDCPVACDVDRRAAEEMKNAHALVPALAAHFDEALSRSLEPGRHHHGARMPDGLEALPLARIAPDRPILDDFADAQFLGQVHRGTSALLSLRLPRVLDVGVLVE